MCKNKITGMVKKRMEDAKKSELRVRKVRKHSLLKKGFVVSATASSKTNYTVTVCANPSCTCQGNREYGESVFCKHIKFVLLKILVVMDESILTNAYIEKDDLVSMFNNAPITIPEILSFSFELSKRNLATILREHPAFKKLQKVILGKKQDRSAKCRACRKEFNVGDIVLRIENCVVVPYCSNKAVVNTISSCAKPACTNSMPKWTSMRKVTEDNIATEKEIGDKEKEEVVRQFTIVNFPSFAKRTK